MPRLCLPVARRQQYPLSVARSILRCLLSSVLRGLPPSACDTRRPQLLAVRRLLPFLLRGLPPFACDTRRPQLLAVRRLLPFLLRGLMPSACGTRCQPVACDCRPPVTRCARFCLLPFVLRGLPPSAWGTRRPPVAGCACFCPLPGAVRCLPEPRGRAAVRKKSRPGSGRLGQGAICTLPYFLAAFLSAA